MALSFLSERLPQLFEQAPSFMAVLRGPEHVFEMTNIAYHQLVGHRAVIGKPLREALPELEGQGFFELMEQVYRTGEPFVGRGLRVSLQRAANGPFSTSYVNFVFQPIIDDDGSIRGIFAEGSDVTDLFESQQALAEKIRLLEQVERSGALHLELSDTLASLSSEEAMEAGAFRLAIREWGCESMVFALVADGGEVYQARRYRSGAMPRCESVRAALSAFGPASLASLRSGKPVVQDVAHPGSPAGPATADDLACAGVSTLLVPFSKGNRLDAFIGFAKPATAPWTTDEVELVTAIAERLRNALDTCRVRAELKAERDESRHIFDNMTEGFAVMNAGWTMKQINALGLRVGQRETEIVVGRSLWDVWPEIIGTEVETRYRRVMGSRQPESFEELVAFSNGENVWLELRLLPVPDGMAVFYRDIGERKAFVAKLLESDRRKDEFLVMLAHELRNPLAPISSAAQMLALVSKDPTRVTQLSQVIARQASHMTSLINDLLDVSRVTTGLVTLESRRLDLNGVVEESIEQVMPFVQAKRHRLSFTPASVAIVFGDRKRLVQVITNLLQNAAKYTPEGGRIDIAMDCRNDEVVLSVTDNGAGMNGDLLPFVFDLFTQERRSSDRSQGGLGLGLALVKSLVSLHGGKVEATSGGAGHGSTFRIWLPLLRTEPGDAPASALALAVAPKALKLLVVDDNVDAANLLAMFLETTGHEVAVHYTSSSALETAQKQKYDVFLLDIGLPDIDGNELARRLRSILHSAKATLIAVTGYGQQFDRETSIAAGFDYYFVKPANPKLIIELLAGIDPAPTVDKGDAGA